MNDADDYWARIKSGEIKPYSNDKEFLATLEARPFPDRYRQKTLEAELWHVEQHRAYIRWYHPSNSVNIYIPASAVTVSQVKATPAPRKKWGL